MKEQRLVSYSHQTMVAHAALIESGFHADPQRTEAALRYLAAMVHCDITGEVRGPREAALRPSWLITDGSG